LKVDDDDDDSDCNNIVSLKGIPDFGFRRDFSKT
jgi:hypothetical protein